MLSIQDTNSKQSFLRNIDERMKTKNNPFPCFGYLNVICYF